MFDCLTGPLLGLAAIALATPAPAAVDGRRIVQQGAGAAPPCESCHGANLQGTPEIGAPAIAGRPAAYIVMRLDHYASPAGHNAMMKQVATALDQNERQAVAAYIAGLRPAVKR